MYGEDIDLSYRIQAMGKKLFYLGTTNIIHFKGESSLRRSRLCKDILRGNVWFVKSISMGVMLFNEVVLQVGIAACVLVSLATLPLESAW